MASDHNRGAGAAHIRIRLDAKTTTITLVGEVDLSFAVDLDKAVLVAATGGAAVVVNVEAATFVDSTGVAFLARLIMVRAPRGIHVVGASASMRGPLATTGITPLLDREPLP